MSFYTGYAALIIIAAVLGWALTGNWAIASVVIGSALLLTTLAVMVFTKFFSGGFRPVRALGPEERAVGIFRIALGVFFLTLPYLLS